MSEQVIHITGPMTIVVTTRMEVVKGGAAGPVQPELIRMAPTAGGLRVRTLGAFQAWAGGDEVSSVLDGRRVQRFIWLYLLARELLRPGNPILRVALMDELYAGIDPEQQRARMRQLLFTMARQLPVPMAGCIKVEGDAIRFDASGCDIDARRLLNLARAVEGQRLPLPNETLAEIEAALVEASEEFIPEWEDIEDQGTGGRGTAREVVNELRGRLEACHLALLSALADSCRDSGQDARAIPYLKHGVARFAKDDEIALRLCGAYERCGRPRTAARLREQYGLRRAS